MSWKKTVTVDRVSATPHAKTNTSRMATGRSTTSRVSGTPKAARSPNSGTDDSTRVTSADSTAESGNTALGSATVVMSGPLPTKDFSATDVLWAKKSQSTRPDSTYGVNSRSEAWKSSANTTDRTSIVNAGFSMTQTNPRMERL